MNIELMQTQTSLFSLSSANVVRPKVYLVAIMAFHNSFSGQWKSIRITRMKRSLAFTIILFKRSIKEYLMMFERSICVYTVCQHEKPTQTMDNGKMHTNYK